MAFEKETCPYCQCPDCEADWVDVAVGYYQCGPYVCPNCGANEIGPEMDLDVDQDLKPIVLNAEHFTADELRTYWYQGDKQSPFANSINGELVSHEEAHAAYRAGVLDSTDEKLSPTPFNRG